MSGLLNVLLAIGTLASIGGGVVGLVLTCWRISHWVNGDVRCPICREWWEYPSYYHASNYMEKASYAACEHCGAQLHVFTKLTHRYRKGQVQKQRDADQVRAAKEYNARLRDMEAKHKNDPAG